MDIFKRIYDGNFWKNKETRSGCGSTLEYTRTLRLLLPALIRKLGVKVMLDAGCGDFNWMQAVDLRGVEYHGWDVVDDLIRSNIEKYGSPERRFSVMDITSPEPYPPIWPPALDLILCRAVLFHFSLANVEKGVANMKASGARWLLASTHPHVLVNPEIQTGDFRRLNLELVMGPAEEKFPDGPGDDGYIGLWRMEGK
jgi:hypothetical protein